MASFRKHSNGTWEYRIRYKDKNSNKYKEKSKRGFKTKKEAQLVSCTNRDRYRILWIRY
nr:Arm DNA-binding domain-containing protein [Bacillus subtilis]